MKKLLIAAVAVCTAALAQAAAVVWNSGEMTTAAGIDAGKSDITMYVWEVAAADITAYKALGAEALSQAIYADYGASTASATITKDTANSGKATVTGADNKSAGQSVYAVVLFTDNTASDTTFMGNYYEGTVPTVGNLNAGNLGLVIGGGTSTTATAWATESVPEPTSGLLLLLGVAGLALRRRRA